MCCIALGLAVGGFAPPTESRGCGFAANRTHTNSYYSEVAALVCLHS